jgi:hypothetical protein
MTRDTGTNVSNDVGDDGENTLEEEVDKTFGPDKLSELMDDPIGFDDGLGLGLDQDQTENRDIGFPCLKYWY